LPIKKLTLGLVLLTIAGTALAQNQTSYKVRSGDTVSKIAQKHNVSEQAVLRANGLRATSKLSIGQSLVIPRTSSSSSDARNSRSVPKTSSHSVARGEVAEAIARKHGATLVQLRTLNPGVNLDRLQIGQKLNVPAPARPAVAQTRRQAPATAPATPAQPAQAAAQVASTSSAEQMTQVIAPPPPANENPTGGEFRMPPLDLGGVEEELVGLDEDIVAMIGTSTTIEDLLKKAQSLKGVRYRYGGASRSGTDCSGFTTQVFASLGIKLPRTSGEQAQVGAHVPRAQLKPGDLVFFRTSRSTRINHVGIYMGSGKFIHASSGGGRVMESALSEGYYNTRFVTARRVVKKTTEPTASIFEFFLFGYL
jgi:cell wall-associated NlpC family hydrolase